MEYCERLVKLERAAHIHVIYSNIVPHPEPCIKRTKTSRQICASQDYLLSVPLVPIRLVLYSPNYTYFRFII